MGTNRAIGTMSNGNAGETVEISKTDINALLSGSGSASLNLAINNGDNLTISDSHYWSTDGSIWNQGAVTGLTDGLDLDSSPHLLELGHSILGYDDLAETNQGYRVCFLRFEHQNIGQIA